ncbi:GlcG/HbpS family heme-binding protein [Lichenicoccus roseus]|uniref:Heme-binding protein n=1 Tax=Lichenicoccus roseus TaxID=2683649 RepID=A0A5R9J1G5_9PROT|nr:heme-binding protein [Lichenicoccus roseus]TLU71495.1 heme-binding protein [Lichenicoccus roseus]
MDLEHARKLIDRALEGVTRFGKPICIAVCDERGLLLGFVRMDGAPVRSVEIAQNKAYSAARLGVTTAAFHERMLRENMPASYFGDPRLTGMPGGSVVLSADGRVVGGVGISGLAPSQDQEIADLMVQ